MIKKIKTFIRLEPQLKIMTLLASAFSVYTWLLFAFFNRYAKFGRKVGLTADHGINPRKDAGITLAQSNPVPEQKVTNITRAIQISSRYIPWKNVCRHQAYQAKLLCNFYQIPYRVFIGLKKDKEKKEIQAHAWTVAGGRIITGFCNPEEYTIQSIYSNE